MDTVKLDVVTTDINEALQSIDWIFTVIPAFAHKPYAKLLAQRLKSDKKVILFPGTFEALEFIKIFGDLGVKIRKISFFLEILSEDNYLSPLLL